MRFFAAAILLLAALPASTPLLAQDSASDVVSARVLSVLSQERITIDGTQTDAIEQMLEAVILSGEREGERIRVGNNYVPLEAGDRFVALRTIDQGGNEVFALQDIDRRTATVLFALLFCAVVIVLTGVIGVRSLMSLCLSISAILFVLVPLLLKGYSPVITTVAVSAVILAAVMYLTHGFRPSTHAAFLGTTLTVLIAGLLAKFAVEAAHLSGFAADAAVYLNASTDGGIDLSGLLLGAIIIGTLGLLDDIAITQTATVGVLRGAAPKTHPRELYRQAMQVGREHIGALVNTLALAYAGVSLPLLLLAMKLETPGWMLINQEIFATEIIRTAIGGIALALAVPLSTAMAVWVFQSRSDDSHAHHYHHH